jgi:hypothetical protein
MVSDADAAATRQVVQNACVRAGRGRHKWIHFKDMSHDDKHGCIAIFTQAQWDGVIVASDTTRVNIDSLLGRPRVQYNYAARYVVERISARAAELGEPATIYFEHRRNFDLDDFRKYMQRLISQGAPRINSRWIDPRRIYQMPKGQDEVLCVADALANAGYRALEPDRYWGRYERSYLKALVGKLWRGPARERNLHQWGLVLMPTALWGTVFTQDYPWLLALPRT